MPQPQIVSVIPNREFIHAHAAPGRIGFAGGADVVSRLIEFAQRGRDDAAAVQRIRLAAEVGVVGVCRAIVNVSRRCW